MHDKLNDDVFTHMSGQIWVLLLLFKVAEIRINFDWNNADRQPEQNKTSLNHVSGCECDNFITDHFIDNISTHTCFNSYSMLNI